MNGPEHYRQAEARLDAAYRIAHPDSGHTDDDVVTLIGIALQRAQVHATLALAAAVALIDEKPHSGSFDAYREWAKTIGPEYPPEVSR